MATIREHLLDIITDIIAEGNETQAALAETLSQGDDTAISVLLSILAALTAASGANDSLLLAINGLRADLEAYHTQTLTAIDTAAQLVNSGVALVRTDTQAMATYLSNGLANSQALIYNQLLTIARNQLALACLCDSSNPALPPPLDLNTPADLIEHCRRVQYFIDKLTDGVCAVTGAIADGLGITADIAATFFGAGLIPGIALASLPTALITGAVVVLGQMASSQILETCTFLQTHSEGLINTLYNAQNAAEAQQAWYAYVDANTNAVTELDLRLILKAGAWAGGMNALYNQSLEWDTSAYNGAACGDYTGCQTLTSVVVDNTGGFVGQYNAVTPNFPDLEVPSSVNTLNGEVFQSPMAWRFGDLSNYSYRVISGNPRITYRNDPPTAATGYTTFDLIADGNSHAFTNGMSTFVINSASTTPADFVLEICPNE